MANNVSPKIPPELLEQQPGLAIALSAFTALVLLFLAGSLATWIFLTIRVARGQPLLRLEPWRPRVWGLADVVIVGILVVTCQILLASVGIRIFGIDRDSLIDDRLPIAVAAFISLGNVVAVGLAVAWITLRFDVKPSHVGFQFSHLPRQFRIGVVASLAMLPLVYLLMAAVSLGLKSEYQHPLLEEMKSSATLVTYLLGALTAVLLAPLAEEFLFRVLLQGWLQSWPCSSLAAIVLGATEEARSQAISSDPAMPDLSNNLSSSNIESSGEELANPYTPIPAQAAQASATLTAMAESTSDGKGGGDRAAIVPPVWPSVVTGTLFGLAHWGYGLSFIPLVVLGILLGLLYRATQSIWPCLIVHMTLNGSSMLGLGIGILLERATG